MCPTSCGSSTAATILRFDGTSKTLRTAGAERRTVEMTWAQKVLSAVAHPQIAYLLLMLGTLGLTVEMWNPGSILPGVVGGICLLLAFFAFQVLPVSYAGVLLILFGLVLLILEVKVTSFGLLAVGGIAQPVLRVDYVDGLAAARAAGGAPPDRPGDADARRRSSCSSSSSRSKPSAVSRLRARPGCSRASGRR